VAISYEEAQVVDAYWREAGYTMPWYLDVNGTAFPAFGVQYVPTPYLFDSDGRVAFAAVETFDFDAAGLVAHIRNLE
jgi:hypothetical protein